MDIHGSCLRHARSHRLCHERLYIDWAMANSRADLNTFFQKLKLSLPKVECEQSEGSFLCNLILPRAEKEGHVLEECSFTGLFLSVLIFISLAPLQQLKSQNLTSRIPSSYSFLVWLRLGLANCTNICSTKRHGTGQSSPVVEIQRPRVKFLAEEGWICLAG